METESGEVRESGAGGGVGLPLVAVSLFKGPVHRARKPEVWSTLLGLQAQVRDYVGVLGLQLYVDEAEGYAFLRSPVDIHDHDDEAEPESGRSGPTVPRLVTRRPLTFELSLLLALLRKKLAEFDGGDGSEPRLIIARSEMVEMIRLFLPSTSNEIRLLDQIDRYIKQAQDLGFLRPLNHDADQFEVERILKAYVDGQWLGEFSQRLQEYRQSLEEQASGGGQDG